MDFYLNPLSDSNLYFIHDIRLKNRDYFFQIDTLVLSTKFILILEVKNISGELYFDKPFNQLIRTYNNKEEGFKNPITQSKRQQSQLTSWLALHKIPPLPVDYLIVISNPSSIIKSQTGNSEAFNKVCHAGDIIEKIHRLEKIHKNHKVSNRDLKKFTKLLLKSHNPLNQNVLQFYDISIDELITGVQCTACSSFPLERKNGIWICNCCGKKTKSSHLQAVVDYFLLVSDSLKNHSFREFIHIPSRHIATQLLTSMNLPHTGTNKSRVYHQPSNFFEMIEMDDYFPSLSKNFVKR